MKTEHLLISAFVGVESAHAFSAFLPSIFTIKQFALDENAIHHVRDGYVPAIIFSLVLAFVTSKLINSYTPLVIAVFVDVFMVATYEIAIRSENNYF